MSTAYSGIGTVEQSSHQVCTSINSLAGSAHHGVTPLWALEKDTTCKAELVHLFARLGRDNACVFGNLRELVPPVWHVDLGFKPARHHGPAAELPPAELYAKGLHDITLTLACQKCAVHPYRHTGCSLRRSDLHVAGTTCAKPYGSCKGDEGTHVK